VHRILRVRAILGALVLVGASARAHGPAPAALEVLEAEGRVPTLLRTSVGVARAEGDGTYSYGCPSGWGGRELAPMAAAGEVIAALDGDVLRISQDRGCHWEASASDVRAVTSDAETIWALTEEEVLRFDGLQMQLWAAVPGRADDLGVDHGRVVVSGVEVGVLVSSVHAPGWTQAEALPSSPVSRLSVRAVGDAEVWLAASHDRGRTLWRGVGDDALVFEENTSGREIHGPVAHGAGWVMLREGVLEAWTGSGWEPVREVGWTGLSERGDEVFAFSLDGVFVVDEALDPSPVFRFVQLGEGGCSLDADAALACELDWAHYGGESGWLDTRPATSPDGARGQAAGGCSLGGRAAMTPTWLLLAFAARRRVGRARGSRSCERERSDPA